MAVHVVLAVRPTLEGKTRLADALPFKDRISLNNKMFRHVFSTLLELFPTERIVLVSRSEELVEEAHVAGAVTVAERGADLNEALSQGAKVAVDRGASAVLTLSTDLPYLEPADLAAMLEAPGDVVIATDRERQGTNALLLRRPFAIPYRYGLGSLTAHRAEAEAAGLAVTVIHRPGLARDIDTPADLAELRSGGA
jgi:2-phospho-L-lactate/phosphoenolpyruvate guanylyltransferase